MDLPSPTELAKTAYAAYGESTGHRTHDDRPMPDWADLGPQVQSAWVSAAGAVALRTAASLTGVTPITTPSVGDVVLVPMVPSENNGSSVAPAIITRVWNPTTINVRILPDGTGVGLRTSLVYAENLEGALEGSAVWTWPGDE